MAAATLLLAGCASLEPLDHPREWKSSPGTVLPNGCPDVSGTYALRATGAFPATEAASPALDEVLGPRALRDAQERERTWPASAGATSATFTASGDWLYVRFHGAQGESSLKFKRKNWWGGATAGSDAMYQCLELELGPALGFDGPRTPISAVPLLYAKGDEAFVFLSKARDGSLIVNYRIDRVFITGGLIGSHARWVGSVWWRYPALLPSR
ncbi:MAG TPA: hypothetical protein VGD76_15240 [Ramlibacter sp.]